ncbi:hypothetical protein CYY_008509 [Polysphondylium violaceum]|uniref:Translation initiation factor IF-2, chloroplastic n=1 Tax=Polysphondylium violaceum TaxID=133409 RepID=A0A8J4PLK4_9MYCE|nr:hypothetical protein CYY_008509 [Polysphondylium violaceum]
MLRSSSYKNYILYHQNSKTSVWVCNYATTPSGQPTTNTGKSNGKEFARIDFSKINKAGTTAENDTDTKPNNTLKTFNFNFNFNFNNTPNTNNNNNNNTTTTTQPPPSFGVSPNTTTGTTPMFKFPNLTKSAPQQTDSTSSTTEQPKKPMFPGLNSFGGNFQNTSANNNNNNNSNLNFTIPSKPANQNTIAATSPFLNFFNNNNSTTESKHVNDVGQNIKLSFSNSMFNQTSFNNNNNDSLMPNLSFNFNNNKQQAQQQQVQSTNTYDQDEDMDQEELDGEVVEDNSMIMDSFKSLEEKYTNAMKKGAKQQKQFQKGMNVESARRHSREKSKFDTNEEEEQQHVDKRNKKKVFSMRDVDIPSTATPENLAPLVGVQVIDIIKLMITERLKPKSKNEILDQGIIDLLAEKYVFRPIYMEENELDHEYIEKDKPMNPSWPKRSPVVTIVGHIDHGKTSLLDYLRKTTIVEKEAGRITQHIGAFEVKISSGEKITFMDTPGHAAFSTMRERGVQTTDIVLLIIAGDDGVQEQTLEAIRAIKKANVSQMIVVINKVDKQGVDPELVKQQLLTHGLPVEGYGGDIPCVAISAKTGQGIKELEETIVMCSELMELRAPIKDVQPSAIVIESTFKKSRGTYASLLVRRGVIKPGQWFVCGDSWGKIRDMRDHLGSVVKETRPGCPVEISGFKEKEPNPGDQLYIFDSEKRAKELIEAKSERRVREDTKAEMIKKNEKIKQAEQETPEEKALQEELEQQQNQRKCVKLFVKADVGGSVEALVTALQSIPYDDEIYYEVVKMGYGEITPTDLNESDFLKTPIVYFGTKVSSRILDEARRLQLPILQSDIIYHAVDHVAKFLEDQLDPIDAYDIMGEAKILNVISINKTNSEKVNVAGCKISDGKIKRSSRIQVKRNDQVVFTGMIDEMRHFKEVVKEVQKGQECGIQLEGFDKFENGDTLLAFNMRKERRKLGQTNAPVINYL